MDLAYEYSDVLRTLIINALATHFEYSSSVRSSSPSVKSNLAPPFYQANPVFFFFFSFANLQNSGSVQS